MTSLRSNFLYNILLTIGSQLMAFMVFPYVSRILLPTNFGLVNFFDATADNFIILSTLGMTTLAVREIAANRNNPEALSKTFSSLFLLHALSTALALLFSVITYTITPELNSHPEMMIIAWVKIIFSFLQVNWLFTGLERFKFISLRSLSIKIIYVICVFLFVRHVNDFDIYFFLLVGMTVATAIVNIYYATQIVSFKRNDKWKALSKPFLVLGLYYIAMCVYSTMNMTFLGIISSTEQVGFYAVSAKLFAIITGLYYAFTAAAMPRMCSLIKNNHLAELKSYIKRISQTVTELCVPIIMFGIIFSPQITYIIAGPAYNEAVPSMRILFIMLYFLGMEKMLIEQILIPMQKDATLLRNASIAAFVSLAIVALLVGRLGSTGSAIAWLAAEMTIFVLSLPAATAFITIHDMLKGLKRVVLTYIPLIPILCAITIIDANAFIQFGVGACAFLTYFIITQLLILKNADILGFLRLDRVFKHTPPTSKR